MLIAEQAFLVFMVGLVISLIVAISAMTVSKLDPEYYYALLDTHDEKLGPKEDFFVFCIRVLFMWVWALILLGVISFKYIRDIVVFFFSRIIVHTLIKVLQTISFFMFLFSKVFGKEYKDDPIIVK